MFKTLSATLKIVSLNVRGVSNLKKIHSIFTWCHRKNADTGLSLIASSQRLLPATLTKITGYFTPEMTLKVQILNKSDQHIHFFGRNVKSKASYFQIGGFSSKKSNDNVMK